MPMVIFWLFNILTSPIKLELCRYMQPATSLLPRRVLDESKPSDTRGRQKCESILCHIRQLTTSEVHYIVCRFKYYPSKELVNGLAITQQ